jgi:heptosyltransferase-3
LTGTRFRLGQRGKGDRFLNVRVTARRATHAYEATVHFAEALGTSCPDRPIYRVRPEHASRARDVLQSAGLVREGRVLPFVALCAGGHQKKRWPLARWAETATRLREEGVQTVLFLGPEERRLESRLREALPRAALVLPPYPLGVFAGLLDEAETVITPDSGPMHVAAALGKPTIALLQSKASRFYAPRGDDDVALLQAGVENVVAAVLAQPAWRELADVRPSRAAPAATS